MGTDSPKMLNLDRIAFVVVREDLDSPVVQSQVVDVMASLSRNHGGAMTLVWFYRVDSLVRRPDVVRTARRDLRDQGITLIAIPFLAGHFPVPWYLLPVVVPQLVLGLAWVRLARGKHVLHCRSYHAALTGAVLKRILPVSLVFDPRSPFAEEHVAAGHWAATGRNYITWKAAERWISRSSDGIVATSPLIADVLAEDAPESRIAVIPNNYPRAFDAEIGSTAAGSALVMCYAGSLGHWNRPEPYLRFLRALEDEDPGAFEALFVVPEASRPVVESATRAAGSSIANINIRSTDQAGMLQILSRCTVGMQFMDTPDNRLSVKAVEYLAAGLPVVVSENVRGAAAMVRQYEVGLVVQADLGNVRETVEFIRHVADEREWWAEKCRRVASERFSTDAVASQLVSLYSSL